LVVAWASPFERMTRSAASTIRSRVRDAFVRTVLVLLPVLLTVSKRSLVVQAQK
jgi:hypothetical protein